MICLIDFRGYRSSSFPIAFYGYYKFCKPMASHKNISSSRLLTLAHISPYLLGTSFYRRPLPRSHTNPGFWKKMCPVLSCFFLPQIQAVAHIYKYVNKEGYIFIYVYVYKYKCINKYKYSICTIYICSVAREFPVTTPTAVHPTATASLLHGINGTHPAIAFSNVCHLPGQKRLLDQPRPNKGYTMDMRHGEYLL